MGWSSQGALDYLDYVDKEKQRKEDLKNKREDTLLSLYLAGEGGSGSTKSKNMESAIEATSILQKRVKDSEINSEKALNFYNSVFEDPYAAKDVLDFLNEQASQFQNDISLEDLPDILSIVNAPTTTEDKIDLFREFELVDLSSKEEYFKLAKKIKNMTRKSGRTAFINIPSSALIDPKKSIERFDEQFEFIGELLAIKGQEFVFNNPANDKSRLTQTAIDDIRNGTPEAKALATQYLYKNYATKDWLKTTMERYPSTLKGIDKDPRMQSIISLSNPSNRVKITVTPEMVKKEPALQPYLNEEVEFELRDGVYYPILGE
jgi:hypothetical protein